MICFDLYQHWSVNRILLLTIGLWPYRQTRLARIQTILISGILMSFIVLQFATFITAQCTPDLVINILSITFIFIIHLIKYHGVLLKIQNIRYLLDQLERLYSQLTNKKEIAILENYAIVVKRYTVIITVLSILYLIMINLLPILPRVLGIFLLINNTRQRRVMLITNEYFLDEKKYFYFILMHTNATLIVGTLVVIATAAMIAGYLQYICGMFRIASYRMEQAFNIKHVDLKNEKMVCEKIIHAVDIHRTAVRFAQIIVSTFEGMYFFLLIFGVSCLTFNLFRISQIMIFGDDIVEVLLHTAFAVTLLLYIFVMNYVSQEITDHNEDVFKTAYNTRWYIAPLHVQKMILFLLQKGTKSFTLNIGGLFVASLENASTLTSASISYFTILYSMRQ